MTKAAGDESPAERKRRKDRERYWADPAKVAARHRRWRRKNLSRERTKELKRSRTLKSRKQVRALRRTREAKEAERERWQDRYAEPAYKAKRAAYRRKYNARPEVQARERLRHLKRRKVRP